METASDRLERYRAEISRSRVVAHRLRIAAAVAVAASVLVSLYAVTALVTGAEDPAVALEILMVTGLAGIVSGIAFFATSWSVVLSASRLEAQVEPLPKS